MFDLLFIVSIVGTIVRLIEEVFTPKIPAENWTNRELYHQDVMNGVPIEQRLKNLENGKYKLTEVNPKSHRDPVNGEIIIENHKLHHEDLVKYGAYQTRKWAKQGKYNLLNR